MCLRRWLRKWRQPPESEKAFLNETPEEDVSEHWRHMFICILGYRARHGGTHCNLATLKLRQENHKLETTVGCVARPHLNKQNLQIPHNSSAWMVIAVLFLKPFLRWKQSECSWKMQWWTKWGLSMQGDIAHGRIMKYRWYVLPGWTLETYTTVSCGLSLR